MERLSIKNIDINELIDSIKSLDSVKFLEIQSKLLLSKFESINDIKNNIDETSLNGFKDMLSEVNELSSTINYMFKKEL